MDSGFGNQPPLGPAEDDTDPTPRDEEEPCEEQLSRIFERTTFCSKPTVKRPKQAS